jgi:ubiquinone/menaquinone biosynthesis C-methylase UbiE
MNDPANQAHTIIDMACGTGSVTRLIAEETADHHRSQQTRIIGVDPSTEALRLAQQSLEEMGSKADFFHGGTDNLASIVQHVDAAFFCNAMHLISNKLDAMAQPC